MVALLTPHLYLVNKKKDKYHRGCNQLIHDSEFFSAEPSSEVYSYPFPTFGHPFSAFSELSSTVVHPLDLAESNPVTAVGSQPVESE